MLAVTVSHITCSCGVWVISVHLSCISPHPQPACPPAARLPHCMPSHTENHVSTQKLLLLYATEPPLSLMIWPARSQHHSCVIGQWDNRHTIDPLAFRACQKRYHSPDVCRNSNSLQRAHVCKSCLDRFDGHSFESSRDVVP